MALPRHMFFLICCFPFLTLSQNFELPFGEKFQKVKFELVNNLIIIPIEVNGAELSFILDSGVNKPILFNLSDKDSIQINNVSEIAIKGLGDGEPIDALSSRGNVFKIGNVVNKDQLLYVVMDTELNLSPRLGLPVHGIIGYDLFRDFVVEVNYSSKYLKLHAPGLYKPKKSSKIRTIPLRIVQNKAYVQGHVLMKNKRSIAVELLVDSGSSDAVWLFEDLDKGLGIPKNNYEDFLGQGLSGSIYGKRTKIDGINLGGFQLREAKTAFPDLQYFNSITSMGNRNGSLGGEVLKRFTLVFNYGNRTLSLRKNALFNHPFDFNMSGIDIQHNGMRYISESIAENKGMVLKGSGKSFGNVQILFENLTRLSMVPEIIVSGIRAGSPGHKAGLQEGDVILSVNGKKVHRYKLQQILHMLNEKDGKKVRLLIERYQKDMLITYVLKDMFK
ncbi:aspartyl protease family protein [Arenibacter sp. M-2]|uniref:aspartyl protease family protein n=1 Tax=unclassified Arenibacter TaxID=2615047 RepID=UPI000D76453E|nr:MULTISPECIES: aspartyl protease family protein [unclassified Arenibacter]MDL5510754.1 aspartyl protease family protein [Arenibacter sp. M-2]PXX26821.1 aspartyl protease [Arenibacter sp. ARW7G5Y1]